MKSYAETKRIGSYPFTKGLFAALSLQEIVWLDIRGEDHHKRFKQALDTIEATTEDQPETIKRFPVFRPSPFTGRYAEFDEALIMASGTGLVINTPPYFEAIRLNISSALADTILQRFEPVEQTLLADAAAAYSA